MKIREMEEDRPSNGDEDDSSHEFGGFNSFEIEVSGGGAYARFSSRGFSRSFWLVILIVGLLSLLSLFILTGGLVCEDIVTVPNSKGEVTAAPSMNPDEEVLDVNLDGYSCGYEDRHGNELCVSREQGRCVRLIERRQDDLIRVVRAADSTNLSIREGSETFRQVKL